MSDSEVPGLLATPLLAAEAPFAGQTGSLDVVMQEVLVTTLQRSKPALCDDAPVGEGPSGSGVATSTVLSPVASAPGTQCRSQLRMVRKGGDRRGALARHSIDRHRTWHRLPHR